jgi:diguanylate cyclase (GGDEF)-like protein
MRLDAYVNRTPPLLATVVGVVFIVCLGVIDYATGPELVLSIFYVVPILLVTHRSGRRAGVWISLFATMTWLGSDLASGREHATVVIHYWNAAIRLGLFIIVVFLAVALNRERVSARQDVLTGAGNRQALQDFLGIEIARMRRFPDPLSCALMDVDRFKSINDSLGHHEGDNVLRAIARVLREHTRAIDVAIRLGGDEFVVLFPGTDAAGARAVVGRIQEGMNGVVASDGGQRPVTFSIGIVTFRRPPKDADEVLDRADALLYRAKGMGGNAIEHEIVT